MSTPEDLIAAKIKKIYPDAASFTIQEVGSPFMGGQAYYVEFASSKVDPIDAFFYAFVDKTDCTLYEDGLEVIKGLQERLDRRRSFWQRISDFDFTETVAAAIALLLAVTFVALMAFKSDGAGREFLAMFSMILGYYFGRNKASQ